MKGTKYQLDLSSILSRLSITATSILDPRPPMHVPTYSLSYSTVFRIPSSSSAPLILVHNIDTYRLHFFVSSCSFIAMVSFTIIWLALAPQNSLGLILPASIRHSQRMHPSQQLHRQRFYNRCHDRRKRRSLICMQSLYDDDTLTAAMGGDAN